MATADKHAVTLKH